MAAVNKARTSLACRKRRRKKVGTETGGKRRKEKMKKRAEGTRGWRESKMRWGRAGRI